MKAAVIFLVAIGLASGTFAEKVVNCYWGTWANYRPGNGKFTTDHINPNLCTHLSYTFFGINNSGEIVMLDSWLDTGLNFISKAVALKQKNPKLKVIATVGGWNEGSTKYSAMAADSAKRKKFVDSTLNFILTHGFDGLDLDWEYPAQRNGSPADKQNFVTLLKELRQAFAPHGLELSIAVAASQESASISYDVPAIAATVDYINLMTYDFAGSWDSVTGFNAPLNGNGGKNVASSVQYWLSAGAPPSKVILGIGSYGRSFTLANSQNSSPGAPAIGGGTAGPYTQETGYLGYNEICEQTGWTIKWDNTAAAPYAVKGNQWVGYDNVESVNAKMDFALSKNLAGAMVWSIETDDFRGICGGAYPILNAINKKLKGSSSSSPNPPATNPPVSNPPATNPPASNPPATNPPSSGENCSADGFYRTKSDCSRYYRCVSGVRYDFQCNNGLVFDLTASACNWATLVNCSS